MRPDRVVVNPPLLNQDLGLFQGVEQLAIEELIAESGAETLVSVHSPTVILARCKPSWRLRPQSSPAPELLFVENPKTGEKIPVVPGELRTRYVEVGRHVAISPGAVPRFLERMHKAYSLQGRIEPILAAACAHHRLLWVHPFLDGNGRVARLMSYAMLRKTLDTRGLWSVARGLAREEAAYKEHLASCDGPRRGDRDGRGTLSEAALASFADFFLRTCIDQVEFMESLMRPDRLRDRILIWAEEEIRAGALPPKSDTVLKAVLYQGQIERGEVESILGTSDRTARRVTSALLEAGALSSTSTRAPFKLAFPAKYSGRWMPGLFPDRDE